MSKVEIEIPDDRWFRGEWEIRPQDKQLCVVIPNIGNKNPLICQWRWGNHNHVGMDAFCDISERFYHESMGIIEEEFRPDYLGMGSVDRWKPLGLPADVEERVLAEIEKWFEEDEQMKYKCVTDGFTKTGYLVDNPDLIKRETVYNGDVLECEGDYIVKNRVSLCHKDSIMGKYHFRKVDK